MWLRKKQWIYRREFLQGGASLKPWAGAHDAGELMEGEEHITALAGPILEAWKEELTKKNMTDAIPLKHTQYSDHSDVKSWEAPCGAVMTVLSPPGLRAPAGCGLGLWDLCPQQRPRGYSVQVCWVDG